MVRPFYSWNHLARLEIERARLSLICIAMGLVFNV